MEISEKQFAAVCFLVLMDHHGAGFQEAHPVYIEEKLSLLDRGYEAYGALDRENQERAKRHCVRWGFDLPEPVRDYEQQLQDSGIFN